MPQKFWKTKTFLTLQREWDQKLKASGFEDAEKSIGGTARLKQRASNSYRGAIQVLREAKLEYYRSLTYHFHETEFSDEVERLIMERRAEGVLIKSICEQLRSMGERCHRETVRHIIRKYEIKWGMKK